jgi:hypothetical protein
MMRNRATQFISILFAGAILLYCVLALAQAGSNSSCHWVFPRWFGCVLAADETLAGGLIGAAGVILGAWIAWAAVQQQINAERDQAFADRIEAERLLSQDLTDYAEGMAAAWKLLVPFGERDYVAVEGQKKGVQRRKRTTLQPIWPRMLLAQNQYQAFEV